MTSVEIITDVRETFFGILSIITAKRIEAKRLEAARKVTGGPHEYLEDMFMFIPKT